MPADGIAIAKTGFGLVEQTMAYSGEEATGFLLHAFATNLRFEADEFNFVKERAKLGTSRRVQAPRRALQPRPRRLTQAGPT